MSSAKKLPKGIIRRGSKYRVSIMVDGERKTATCDSLDDAVKEAKRIRDGVDHTPTLDPWTYAEAADRWLRDVVEVEGSSVGSIRTRRSASKQVVDYFGADTLLDDTSPNDLASWKRVLKQERGFSPAYINGVLTCFRGMHRHAYACGGRTGEPPKILPMKIKKGRVRFMSKDEEERSLAWCDHHGKDLLRDFIILGLDTGLRISELLALKFSDVSPDRIHVWSSKSDAGVRAVPITKRALKVIRDRKVRAGGYKDASKVLGGATAFQIREPWNTMREALGLSEDEQFIPHLTRHTYCTRLVSGGLDLRTAQVLMGHENIKTTMRYAQFVPDNMFKAASILDDEAPAPLWVVNGGDE